MWFDMVFTRAMCPQGCKTEDQAKKWEAQAKRMILQDPYAVSQSFMIAVPARFITFITVESFPGMDKDGQTG